MKNFLKYHPQLQLLIRRITDDLFNHDSHHPAHDKKGIALSVDSPYNLRYATVNTRRQAYLRQHYGQTVNQLTSTIDGTTFRYVYGTGDGSQTVGTPVFHSSTRPLTEDMNVVSTTIHDFLQSKFVKDDVNIPQFNHLVVLAYYDRKKVKRNTCQLNYHRDVHYSPSGEYSKKQNSQEENSPTAILCLGERRILRFRLCVVKRNMSTGQPKVHTQSVVKEFTLNHGDLFLLHPLDEKPFVRKELSSPYSSYLQHGGVCMESNHLSIGLAFRKVVHCRKVRVNTGIPALSATEYASSLLKFGQNHLKLKKYLKKNGRKKRQDDHNVRARYQYYVNNYL